MFYKYCVGPVGHEVSLQYKGRQALTSSRFTISLELIAAGAEGKQGQSGGIFRAIFQGLTER